MHDNKSPSKSSSHLHQSTLNTFTTDAICWNAGCSSIIDLAGCSSIQGILSRDRINIHIAHLATVIFLSSRRAATWGFHQLAQEDLADFSSYSLGVPGSGHNHWTTDVYWNLAMLTLARLQNHFRQTIHLYKVYIKLVHVPGGLLKPSPLESQRLLILTQNSNLQHQQTQARSKHVQR